MKFVPRTLSAEAADASRGHDRSPLRELAILLLTVGGVFLVLYLVVVLVVDQAVIRLSPQREAQIFATFTEALPQPGHLAPDLEARFQSAKVLMERLHEQSPLREVPLRLVVWDHAATNAVAFPGGTIGVTAGLLEAIDDDRAMAFVLAHEIGHFQHRHHLRGLGRQIGFQVVRALLFSGSRDIAVSADQFGRFTYLSHSRKSEAEADRFAVELLYKTFGSTGEVGSILNTLDGQSRPGWAYMFSTHPSAQNRIKKLREYAATLEAADEEPADAGNPEPPSRDSTSTE